MKTLQISENKARELYKTGSTDFKTILEDSFGKEFFSTKVTDRIKTYEDACRELGLEPINEAEFEEMGLALDDIAYQKIKVVIRALNEGWAPDMFNSNIYRWYPWFRCNESASSFAFCDSFFDATSANAGGGSRLCLKSEELANYCGKQFIDLWKQIIL